MLALKRAEELLWNDLRYIELPIHARSVLLQQTNLCSSLMHGLQTYYRLNASNGNPFPVNRLITDVEMGKIFFINHSTRLPAVTAVNFGGSSIEYQLSPLVSGNELFRIRLDQAIREVRKPEVFIAHHTERKDDAEPKKQKSKKNRVRHRVLLEVEPEKGFAMPDRHNVTVAVQSNTKGSIVTKQVKNVVRDRQSAIFVDSESAEFKIFVIEPNNDVLIEELKRNGNLDDAEQRNDITPLEIVSKVESAKGVHLHTAKYVIPTVHRILIEFEYKPMSYRPASELLILTDDESDWQQVISLTPTLGDVRLTRKGRGKIQAEFVDLPKNGKFSCYRIPVSNHGSPITIFKKISMQDLESEPLPEEVKAGEAQSIEEQGEESINAFERYHEKVKRLLMPKDRS